MTTDLNELKQTLLDIFTKLEQPAEPEIKSIEQPDAGLQGMVGKKVIVRTYSAGVFYGTLKRKSGNEVILKDARRLWYWHAEKSISLSAVSLYGIKHDTSKIAAEVHEIWLEAIEIIPATEVAQKSIESAPEVKAS